MAEDRPAALVTGSASGVGRAAALRLARAAWTPMKRNVTAADVAETIFSLIASNPYVTGETIVVDGGYAATT
jgi:3-oxoacyl-[acyl-carrier protein] reductase